MKLLNYIGKKTMGGLLFGLTAALVFGAILWVQAVAPGRILVPTFNPQTDDVKLALECVTARYRKNNQTILMYPSSSGATYAASDVVTGAIASGAGQLTCNPGWFMSGCSSFCGGNIDPDEAMIGQNTCQGTPNGSCSDDYTFIRCCKNP